MSALLDSLARAFEALPPDRVEAAGLGEARRAAMHEALAEGLPTQRAEAWKYTALRALGARRFQAQAPDPRENALDPGLLAGITGPRLVFVNGRFDASLSPLQGADGVVLESLACRLARGDAAVPDAGTAIAAGEVFARWNQALALDGACIDVADGVDAGLVQLVFVGAPAAADLAVHLRHRIRLGAGARLRLVEHHLGAGTHRHLLNHALDASLGRGAWLRHARLQDEDAGASLFAHTAVHAGEDADYARADLELGAGLSRHVLAIRLDGARARCAAGGILLADGRRHLDTRLSLTHAARDTACQLPWRGLATDRARLAFLGAITIEEGADGSDASLSCKNLLLSDGAEVDAQPVLVIHADEVKAAHGATVGRLDPTALFYLRSRGIPQDQARALLTQAFCREALAPLGGDAAVQAVLSPHLEARLLAAEPA